MRALVVIFLATTVLAGCNDKVNDKPAQSSSDEAAERVYGSLTSTKVKKDDD